MEFYSQSRAFLHRKYLIFLFHSIEAHVGEIRTGVNIGREGAHTISAHLSNKPGDDTWTWLSKTKDEIFYFTCVETGPPTSPRLLCWVVGTSGRRSGMAENLSPDDECSCGIGLERHEGISEASPSIYHPGRSRKRTCSQLFHVHWYFLRNCYIKT